MQELASATYRSAIFLRAAARARAAALAACSAAGVSDAAGRKGSSHAMEDSSSTKRPCTVLLLSYGLRYVSR